MANVLRPSLLRSIVGCLPTGTRHQLHAVVSASLSETRHSLLTGTSTRSLTTTTIPQRATTETSETSSGSSQTGSGASREARRRARMLTLATASATAALGSLYLLHQQTGGVKADGTAIVQVPIHVHVHTDAAYMHKHKCSVLQIPCILTDLMSQSHVSIHTSAGSCLVPHTPCLIPMSHSTHTHPISHSHVSFHTHPCLIPMSHSHVSFPCFMSHRAPTRTWQHHLTRGWSRETLMRRRRRSTSLYTIGTSSPTRTASVPTPRPTRYSDISQRSVSRRRMDPYTFS